MKKETRIIIALAVACIAIASVIAALVVTEGHVQRTSEVTNGGDALASTLPSIPLPAPDDDIPVVIIPVPSPAPSEPTPAPVPPADELDTSKPATSPVPAPAPNTQTKPATPPAPIVGTADVLDSSTESNNKGDNFVIENNKVYIKEDVKEAVVLPTPVVPVAPMEDVVDEPIAPITPVETPSEASSEASVGNTANDIANDTYFSDTETDEVIRDMEELDESFDGFENLF
jgi:hypothetical protein